MWVAGAELSQIPVDWEFDHALDGQDHGCGQMLLELRIAFEPMEAGARVLVASRDAGSPMEIPAWCRLTGHTLVAAEPPYYLVRKRPENQGEA